MVWLASKLLNASWWSCLFFVSGVLLLTVAAVPDANLEDYRPELLANKKIVVDPGHGGIDSGAVSALGDFEKEITLQIAKKLAERIRATGAQVILTREEDIDYYTQGKGGKRRDLEQRLEMTRAYDAQMLISIHANADKGRRWTGAQVFYHPASTEGKELAGCIQQYLKNFPPGNGRKEKANDYYILREINIPAVIVEVGFLSNAAEAARLTDESYQEQLAESILCGIMHHIAVKEGFRE